MSGLRTLQHRYPWPGEPPPVPPTNWGWGIAGEALLQRHLPATTACILEIGSLLGASARYFAGLRPAATVVCIDPWNDMRDRPLLRHAPELAPILNDRRNGLYELFLSSNWAFRDRIVPLRGYSPEALRVVYDAGVAPDFIYIDGSHHYEDVLIDLHCCQLLWPQAVLSGDDWNWPGVCEAVSYFARLRGYTIEHESNTWVVRVPADGGVRDEAALRPTPLRRSPGSSLWSRLLPRRR